LQIRRSIKKRNGSRKTAIQPKRGRIKEPRSQVCTPYDKDRHHRLAKVNGGTYAKWNLSEVYRYQHEAWHTIFEVKPTEEIAPIFYRLANLLGFIRDMPRKQAREVKREIQNGRLSPKVVDAWFALFAGMSIWQAIKWVNDTWIPSTEKIILRNPMAFVILKQAA
jgi:hypothetical protein